MDKLLFDLMNTYYDECAEEYELIYQGLGPAQIKHPALYKNEVSIIRAILANSIRGKVLDFACGTGYWIPSYIQNCHELSLVDQSINMLSLAKGKVRSAIPLRLIPSSIYEVDLPTRHFGSILAGFIFSHIEQENEIEVLAKLLRSIEKNGPIIIVDSAWSRYRKETIPKKESVQTRTLKNGKEFSIYKRYYEKDDIINLGKKANCYSEVLHDGDVFIVGHFKTA